MHFLCYVTFFLTFVCLLIENVNDDGVNFAYLLPEWYYMKKWQQVELVFRFFNRWKQLLRNLCGSKTIIILKEQTSKHAHCMLKLISICEQDREREIDFLYLWNIGYEGLDLIPFNFEKLTLSYDRLALNNNKKKKKKAIWRTMLTLWNTGL